MSTINNIKDLLKTLNADERNEIRNHIEQLQPSDEYVNDSNIACDDAVLKNDCGGNNIEDSNDFPNADDEMDRKLDVVLKDVASMKEAFNMQVRNGVPIELVDESNFADCDAAKKWVESLTMFNPTHARQLMHYAPKLAELGVDTAIESESNDVRADWASRGYLFDIDIDVEE